MHALCFYEITTFHAVVQRYGNFTQQPSTDNPEGTRGQLSPLCCDRGTRLTVRMDPNSSREAEDKWLF